MGRPHLPPQRNRLPRDSRPQPDRHEPRLRALLEPVHKRHGRHPPGRQPRVRHQHVASLHGHASEHQAATRHGRYKRRTEAGAGRDGVDCVRANNSLKIRL